MARGGLDIVWMVLLVVLLGIFTYLILQRSVAKLTSTPIWLLWLVVMTPALIWMGWYLARGDREPVPVALFLTPAILCPILYLWLVRLGQRGDRAVAEEGAASENGTGGTLTPPQALDTEQENQLRGCFPWTVYAIQQIEQFPQAVICRGQLRASPEEAYRTIRDKVEEIFGDRFLIVFQEGSLKSRPIFVLVHNPRRQGSPNAVYKSRELQNKPALLLGLLWITLFTTTVVGAEFAAVFQGQEPAQEAAELLRLESLTEGLPYAVSLMAILGGREIARYLSATCHRIGASLPYFIPVPGFLGTFGAFVQIRDPIPNRKAFFDMSLTSSLTGLLLAIPILFWGLSQSTVTEMTEESGILNLQSLNPRFSFLLALASRLALGTSLTPDAGIELHPVAIAGYLGLIVTAFNLMPIGQLDGGHLTHAMFGQRTSATIGQIARLLMLLRSLIDPEFFLWAIFLFLLPLRDEPALNDVSEIGTKRDVSGFCVLVLLLLILLPAPSSLMKALNF